MVDYAYLIGDISATNLRKLVKHCDGKIDRFFAKLDKKIERLVKAEVKKQLSIKKNK